MKRRVPISDFTRDLIRRIDEAKGIDCCKEEIKLLAKLAGEKMPGETIEIDWKE